MTIRLANDDYWHTCGTPPTLATHAADILRTVDLHALWIKTDARKFLERVADSDIPVARAHIPSQEES